MARIPVREGSDCLKFFPSALGVSLVARRAKEQPSVWMRNRTDRLTESRRRPSGISYLAGASFRSLSPRSRSFSCHSWRLGFRPTCRNSAGEAKSLGCPGRRVERILSWEGIGMAASPPKEAERVQASKAAERCFFISGLWQNRASRARPERSSSFRRREPCQAARWWGEGELPRNAWGGVVSRASSRALPRWAISLGETPWTCLKTREKCEGCLKPRS